MNRHHQARRSVSGNQQKILSAAQTSYPSTGSNQSSQLQPTPLSHTSPPSVSRSPPFVIQGGMIQPGSGLQAQQQLQQQQSHLPPHVNIHPQARSYPGIAIPTSSVTSQPITPNTASGHIGCGRSSAVGPKQNHWPSPYQTHIEQLGKLTRPFLSLFI